MGVARQAAFGGTISLQAAIQAPDLFENVILSAPGLIGGPEDPDAATCNQDLIAMVRERGTGPWLADRWMSIPPEIFAGIDCGSPLWHRLQDAVLTHRWEVLTTPIMAGMFVDPQTPRSIASITSRITLLSGDRDMASFLRCTELIRRSGSAARKHVIAGGHHLCLLTHADHCAELIRTTVDESQSSA